MAWWIPEPIWSDRAFCYIIGGGPSLEKFDWSALRGEAVLGCNVAFYHGVDICPITIFGDIKFLKAQRDGLEKYAASGGIVVTNGSLRRRPPPPEWLRRMKKQLKGLGLDALGWNGNTGASAINLALLFRAPVIYLLGYDMKISPEGKGNYHNAYSHVPKDRVYNRFLKGMGQVAKDLPKMFPKQQVINLTEDSRLDVFPKMSLVEHFEKRRAVA